MRLAGGFPGMLRRTKRPRYPWKRPRYPWKRPRYPWKRPRYPWKRPRYPCRNATVIHVRLIAIILKFIMFSTTCSAF